MKKITLNLVLLLFSLNMLSQQKVLVLDKMTRLPVQNITFWTKGNPISFTTDSKGIFIIQLIKSGKIFIKSEIYKAYNNDIEALPAIIYLEPINEKENHSIVINASEGQKIGVSDSVTMKIKCLNQIIVKWIKNDRERKIASLDLYIRSITKNTTFKLRFFRCDSLQNPSTNFFDKEIVVNTSGKIDLDAEIKTNAFYKKHEKITLNLEEYNIMSPNENYYIGIEILQLADNQLKIIPSVNKFNEKAVISQSLSPFVAHAKLNYNDTMIFSIDNWKISDKSILLNVQYVE